ncbi:uncharacterized protein N7496_003539 [Penicillium cataractarum]|uniref:Integrase zinc-binding domain-containing protein n=1 Tax=Penicillium cataractarum TaxID=2100454 RepID=A0A9W9SMB6_9EURO|nr:uncharacterized protein N7496_003539 [Penicillium cataractarum]KAJ5381111.1 hypothetical protein N7496_003539 [Penicillium cataractarum]
MTRDIFEEYHDSLHHLGFARTYHQIQESFYVRDLAKHLHGVDDYGRDMPADLPEPSDDTQWPLFETIVTTKTTHNGRRTQYLLRRRGIGPAWDEWHTEEDVRLHRPDMIEAYEAS